MKRVSQIQVNKNRFVFLWSAVLWWLFIIIATIVIPDHYYWDIFPYYKLYFGFSSMCYLCLCILAFCCGSIVANMANSIKQKSNKQESKWQMNLRLKNKLLVFSIIISSLTISGHLIFFNRILKAIGGLSQLMGTINDFVWVYQLKLLVTNASEDITVLLVLSPLALMMWTILFIGLPEKLVKERLIAIVFCIFLTILVVTRSFVWTERIILVELLFPSFLIILKYNIETKGLRKVFLVVTSVLIMLVVILVIGFMARYKFNTPSTVAFKWLQLYMIGSINNTMYLVEQAKGPITFGWYTFYFIIFNAFGRLLGLDRLSEVITGIPLPTTHADWFWFAEFLGIHPALNTYSAFGDVYLDWGYLGGITEFLLIGVVTGIVFKLFLKNDFKGLLIYPLMFTTFVDFPRTLHLTSFNFVVQVVVILIGDILLRLKWKLSK